MSFSRVSSSTVILLLYCGAVSLSCCSSGLRFLEGVWLSVGSGFRMPSSSSSSKVSCISIIDRLVGLRPPDLGLSFGGGLALLRVAGGHLPLTVLLVPTSGSLVSWRIFSSIVPMAVLACATLSCNSESPFSLRSILAGQGWKSVKSVSGMTLIPTRTDRRSGKVGQNKARVRSMLSHGTEPVPILLG